MATFLVLTSLEGYLPQAADGPSPFPVGVARTASLAGVLVVGKQRGRGVTVALAR